jgi:hypothetical protein
MLKRPGDGPSLVQLPRELTGADNILTYAGRTDAAVIRTKHHAQPVQVFDVGAIVSLYLKGLREDSRRPEASFAALRPSWAFCFAP